MDFQCHSGTFISLSSPRVLPSLSPTSPPAVTLAGRFSTIRPPQAVKFVPFSLSTHPLPLYGNLFHRISLWVEKSKCKNRGISWLLFTACNFTFSATPDHRTTWALKPTSPGTHSHRSLPHWLPDGGESR